MSIEKEIERAVRKISADNWNNDPKTPDEQAEIIAAVKTSLKNSTYDFSTVRAMKIKQNEKEQLVKQYTELYSAENILCQCIKQILDKVFKIKYANRGKISKELFSTIPATIQMADFTIVKFDFKDYFNSVSTIYVFEKYIKQRLYDRLEKDLVKSFVYATKYAYAGLCTSNAIAEIIAAYFDEAVKQVLSESGLIYYERYVDDCIMILNEHMDEKEINDILDDILPKIFYDTNIERGKCKTEFNKEKFCYISRRKIFMELKPLSIDFLGYEFQLTSGQSKNKVEIKYGITQAKRKKYSERLNNIILLYMSDKPNNAQSLELLRHRIAAFSSRTVYLSKFA